MFGMTPFGHNEDYLFTLYDNFAHNFFHGSGKTLPDFRTDIWDEGNAYVLEAELPGFKKEDIRLEVKGQVLTVSASRVVERSAARSYVLQERKAASFSRSFDISGIAEEKISASFEDGVLRLTMPKVRSSEDTAKRIQIL